MYKKNTILHGTLILTLTGFVSRLMGFFYRIFLSRTFKEEGVGLYQLIFPVYALCFSLTTAGIETAISRTVARKISLGRPGDAKAVLKTGICISLALSCISVVILRTNAAYIAETLLGDSRCRPLLDIIACSFPFAAVHSCICGYYYGLKKTAVPASAQLIEQVSRISSVYILYIWTIKNGNVPSVTVAAAGLVIGEIISSLYTLYLFPSAGKKQEPHTKFSTCAKELLSLSVPLTANRVLINLLQSIEAVSIPGRLQLYHYSSSEALSLYGVLNGMALPCILFPSAVTSSVSIMLMPAVAEIQAVGDKSRLRQIIKKVVGTCFILGLFSCLFFLLSGPFIGLILFDSRTAGKFLVTLAWICPFLYTNSAFSSVINGLGKTGCTFAINTTGLLIRIISVFFIIPIAGMQGYLWGLLVSQLTVSVLSAGATVWYVKQ